MKHRRPEGVTRQGVRDLDLIGPRPANKRPPRVLVDVEPGCPRCGSPFLRGCPCEDHDVYLVKLDDGP